MIAVDPNEPTEEERKQNGITKARSVLSALDCCRIQCALAVTLTLEIPRILQLSPHLHFSLVATIAHAPLQVHDVPRA